MTSLTSGDIVWVLFPHVEEQRLRARPALIVASGLGREGALCWVLMITSAARAKWPGDVIIGDHRAAGLPISSKIRTEKIATLDSAAASLIGRLPESDMALVRTKLATRLGLNEKLRSPRGG